MRYGIFSDIHANLTAAREVVERLRNHAVDALLCLGDIVGYGAQPDECVEYIASLNDCTVIAGNHDWACSGRTGLEGFRKDAADSVLWTRKMLSEQSKRYLAGLHLTWKGNGVVAAHASPVNPSGWKYISNAELAQEVIDGMEENICFIGHTHYPAVARLKTAVAVTDSTTPTCREGRIVDVADAPWRGDRQRTWGEIAGGASFTLEENCKYLVNVGSAGYLRRKAGMASYVIFDEEECTVSMFEP